MQWIETNIYTTTEGIEPLLARHRVLDYFRFLSEKVFRRVGREGTLVEAVADRRPRAEIVLVPIMLRHPGLQAGREADGGSRHQAGLDEIPAFHYPFTFLMMLRDPSGLTP